MSEYQYYEFLAIDQPLTDTQMAELRSISSRAEITPTLFSNEYNYGDLRADPRELLQRYFDVYLYVANRGTHRLGLRFPADLLELQDLKSYCVSDQVSVGRRGNFVLLDVWSETEDYESWVEGAGWMASVAPVREEMLRGDLRAAYLTWLLAVQNEELDVEVTEPPVPQGLANLSAPLASLAQYLRLDEHLIAAAAECSASGPTETTGLRAWIGALPSDQKDALLLEVVEGNDPHVGTKLFRRFRSEVDNGARANEQAGRTVGELIERADALRNAHEAEQARGAERDRRRPEKAAATARAKHLDDLAKRKTAARREAKKGASGNRVE